MNAEELDHLLKTADWDPDVDPVWAEASGNRLIAYAEQAAIHRRHVRQWRLVLGSALAVSLVMLWWTQTAPLRTAIRATAEVSPSIQLLQETQKETSSFDLVESPLRKTWNSLIALVTPGARLAAVTDARLDSATGLVRASVRGTDGYVLVDPHLKTLVGVVGTKIPNGSQQEQPSLPLFARLELAREIASVDAAVQQTHSQTVAVAPLTAYRLSSPDRASSSTAMRPQGEYLQAGTFVAVQLQRSGGNGPELTAIVNTVERRVVQIVNTDQVRGMVVGEAAGSYAIIEPEAY